MSISAMAQLNLNRKARTFLLKLVKAN